LKKLSPAFERFRRSGIRPELGSEIAGGYGEKEGNSNQERFLKQ